MERIMNCISYRVYERIPRPVMNEWEKSDRINGQKSNVFFCDIDENTHSDKEGRSYGVWFIIPNRNRWVLHISPEYIKPYEAIPRVDFMRERSSDQNWYDDFRQRVMNALQFESLSFSQYDVFRHSVVGIDDCLDKWAIVLESEWFPNRSHFSTFIISVTTDVEVAFDVIKSTDPDFFSKSNDSCRYASMREFRNSNESERCIIGAVKNDTTEVDDGRHSGLMIGAAVLLKNQLISMGVIGDYLRLGAGSELMLRAFTLTKGNLWVFLPDSYMNTPLHDCVGFFQSVKLSCHVRSVEASQSMDSKVLHGTMIHYSNFEAR